MHVFPVNNCTNQESVKHNTSFKQGLTRDVVNHVKNMAPDEYQRIAVRLENKFGICANLGESNAVAFCVEKTAEIMKKAGFMLPGFFKFEPFSKAFFGDQKDDTVRINSNFKEFKDLEKLNKAMERAYCWNGIPHFLDIYIHEFSHAAHCENIKSISKFAYFDILSSFKPNEMMLEPMIMLIKRLCPGISKNQMNKLLPEHKKLFGTDNLQEYFAEKNSRILEKQLGKNFCIDNIKPNLKDNYNGFPEDWDIEDELNKINKYSNYYRDIKEVLKSNLGYFEGEIWNGNTDGIIDKNSIFVGYCNINANR